MIDRGLWNWAIPGGCWFFGGLVGAHRRHT
jgi:hypothetical protein